MKTLRHTFPLSAVRRGFTLLELLIVIAIIAIIAGMLLPALNKVRDRAYSIDCISNMKQIQQALNCYADDHQGVFPSFGSPAIDAETNWIYKIYFGNYLNKGAVFICKSQRNRKTDAADTNFLADPQSMKKYENGSYGYNWLYLGTCVKYDRQPTAVRSWDTGAKRNRIRKPSETISLVDVVGGAMRDRGSFACDYIFMEGDSAAGQPDSRHSGGCNIAWVDGHVGSTNRIDRKNPYLTDPFRKGDEVGDPANYFDLD